jgi:type IV pilus assembly protein PilB
MDLFDKKKISEDIERLNREAEERDAERRASEAKLPNINLFSTSVDLDVLKKIPEEKARLAEAAAIDFKQNRLAIAIFNENNPELKKLVEEFNQVGVSVSLFISSLRGLQHIWGRYRETKEATRESILEGVDIKETESFVGLDLEHIGSQIKQLEKSSADTTGILDFILGSAITIGASDIHFEPTKEDLLIRFRIDGLLYKVCSLEKQSYMLVLNRLKLVSGLKLNISDAAQDGRFTTTIKQEDIEIRTSVIPSEYGETVVMRVLDPKTISLSLSDLGLRSDDMEIINKELKRPNGTILVTGPTGSGKTTSLYAFLKTVENSRLKIITIEDPIEYHLNGIEQTQVDSDSGYTFASGLRSILRQDPDIILVGEIRDLETAEIGMNAALTGHLVFSTLHTNNAVGAVPRLVDLGVNTSIIGPAINLIISQRLIRKLCNECKMEITLEEAVINKIKAFIEGLPEKTKLSYSGRALKFYEAKGCAKCHEGFNGRMGIFEFLKCGDEIEALIANESTEESIKKLGIAQGMVEMQGDGVLKVVSGFTTLNEVERITGPIDWLS